MSGAISQDIDSSTSSDPASSAEFSTPAVSPRQPGLEHPSSDSLLPTLAQIQISASSGSSPAALKDSSTTGSSDVSSQVQSEGLAGYNDAELPSSASTSMPPMPQSGPMPVAQILRPEASDGSTSILTPNTSTVAAALRQSPHAATATSSLNIATAATTGKPTLQDSHRNSSHSVSPAMETAPSDVMTASPSTPPPSDTVSQTINAIKAKDFISSPPPQRPAPTVTGQELAKGAAPTQPGWQKGMASAPAVQTLATLEAQGSATSTSAPYIQNSSANPPSTSTASTSTSKPPTPSMTRPPVTVAQGATAIRKPGQPGSAGAGLASRMPPSLQAKLAAMAARSNNPTAASMAQSGQVGAGERIPTATLLRQSSAMAGTLGGGMSARPAMGAPGRIGMTGHAVSAGPQIMMGGASGLGKRRGPGAGLSLAQMGMNGPGSKGTDSPLANGLSALNGGPPMGRANRPQMRLPPGSSGPGSDPNTNQMGGTPFSNFSKIVDPSGSLNFQNKAVLHAKGVDFSNGNSFKINMDELQLQDELGSGNYGTVQKVFHKVTKVTMAMKEIRLELDDSKLKAIITELDILHRAISPEIVEFYGAFFIESCVYYCMEFMDAGSLDNLAGYPVPEPVLKRVTASMVRGLKFLKDELQTMHRDVKPTNVLINSAGAIKLCDFGVSGQLERSLAKTNIGCQSYMAPERIKGESLNFLGTYTVSSDVWSLGLSIIEFARGHYPYPPETYSNVFAQLQAIVHGDPPSLPDGYSREADDFVARCLHKDANKRPSYAQLLDHPFLRDEPTMQVDMAGWVKEALEFKKQKRAAAGGAPPSGTASGVSNARQSA